MLRLAANAHKHSKRYLLYYSMLFLKSKAFSCRTGGLYDNICKKGELSLRTILLHGLGQTPESWRLLSEKFGAACPDLAAYLAGCEPTYDTLYRAFCAFACQSEEPLLLCGLSLGGILALQYAAEHPERVTGLILIAAPDRMPKGLLTLQDIIFRFMPEKAFAATGFCKRDFRSLTSSMRKLDFGGQLRKITCPTLVLCGERDKANQKSCRRLAESLPNAQFESVPGAGHEVNVDAGDWLADRMDRWLKQQGESLH